MYIGIDLGTTYSLVARLDERTHGPVLMPDHSHKDTLWTPSIVHLADEDHTAYVGQSVETLMDQDPSIETRVLRFFKRQLGSGRPMKLHRGTPWHPEAIAAIVLKKLRSDAEMHAMEEIEGVVVTVPAHFNDLQRKAVKSAVFMADMPLLGLADEPVAAALAYGVTKRQFGQTILVYDLGGGTFDATVLTVTEEAVQVLSKDGLTELGGKDFDDAIVDMIFDQFAAGGVELSRESSALLLQARRVAEEIKIELCMPGVLGVRRTVVLGAHAAELRISRRGFEERIEGYLDRTEEVLLRCVKGAGLEPSDVEVVLLVGGSSLTPAVKTRIDRLFGNPHQRVLFNEPTKAVVMGAAMHAHQLNGQAELHEIPPAFRGITGHHLGVRARDPRTGRVHVDVLIRKNMPLPARNTRTYYTSTPGQRRIRIEVVQCLEEGEETVLGDLIVGPLPDAGANYPIEVELAYNQDGTVSVQARDPNTRQELRKEFGQDSAEGYHHLTMQHQLVRSTVIQNV